MCQSEQSCLTMFIVDIAPVQSKDAGIRFFLKIKDKLQIITLRLVNLFLVLNHWI